MYQLQLQVELQTDSRQHGTSSHGHGNELAQLLLVDGARAQDGQAPGEAQVGRRRGGEAHTHREGACP